MAIFVKQLRAAPVLEPPQRQENVDYRRDGDEPTIRRVSQSAPKGFPKKLVDYIPVSGTSYREEAVQQFINGRERSKLFGQSSGVNDHI